MNKLKSESITFHKKRLAHIAVYKSFAV